MKKKRRIFLKETTTLMAGMSLTPGFVFGGNLVKKKLDIHIAPDKKIGLALIGCNNMGWYNLTDMLSHPSTHCVAICDVDEKILEARAKEIEDLQGTKPRHFLNYKEMLKKNSIDAVIVGSPDHWHCLHAVDSMKAGKDVYIEKPLANSIAECNIMAKAAKIYNRVVAVGQQQRSGIHWQKMIDYIQSGKLGRISHIKVWANFNYGAGLLPVPDSEIPPRVNYNEWLGPAPDKPFNTQRFHNTWRWFYDYGGGLMTDWGVHLLDMALWAMKTDTYPKNVFSYGGKFKYPENSPEVSDTQTVIYEMPDYVLTWEHAGGIETGPYGRNYGLAFIGNKGTLVADRDNWEVLPEKNEGKNIIDAVKVETDHQDHKKHVFNFLDCIKTRETPACSIENGKKCAIYSHLGNIALKTGENICYDPETERFLNDVQANQYLKPTYRHPWQFPII